MKQPKNEYVQCNIRLIMILVKVHWNFKWRMQKYVQIFNWYMDYEICNRIKRKNFCRSIFEDIPRRKIVYTNCHFFNPWTGNIRVILYFTTLSIKYITRWWDALVWWNKNRHKRESNSNCMKICMSHTNKQNF